MRIGEHITRLNLAGLRIAVAVLRKHEAVIIDAIADGFEGRALPGAAKMVHDRFIDALYRICDDGFRSAETRGGS
jgi:hypothetical protein